ncbi:SecDF P1 head subdomain-containing protein [Ruania halotolerans]|uniref:SecDF P1 head subdomain-containing protein n=1 Tax=Ruania halotolerans TaxID=2897773 RepID=UPI001E5FA6FE|nr:hypothetical protein [Ruania halotolerans]UFU05960.1 hypothetical protein LQF10_16255 [Ruania halotolerans]
MACGGAGEGQAGGVRGRIAAIAGTAGLVLVGCSAGDTDDGEVTLADPFSFALVDEVVSGPNCPDEYLSAPEGSECFALSEQIDVHTVRGIELGKSVNADGAATDETVVQIELLPETAEEFAELTETASVSDLGRIALLVDGAVISAPTVMERIDQGTLSISGWDESEARAFVDSARR